MARAVGRPTKYKPEYCQMLIEHARQGLSFESFAAVINVNIDTIYHWCTLFPEFSEAKKMATCHSRLFWESMGVSGVKGFIPNFSTSGWIFNMKCRFGWRDGSEVSKQTTRQVEEVFDAGWGDGSKPETQSSETVHPTQGAEADSQLQDPI